MKKILSLLVAVIFILSLSMNAIANSVTYTPFSNYEPGTYTLSTKEYPQQIAEDIEKSQMIATDLTTSAESTVNVIIDNVILNKGKDIDTITVNLHAFGTENIKTTDPPSIRGGGSYWDIDPGYVVRVDLSVIFDSSMTTQGNASWKLTNVSGSYTLIDKTFTVSGGYSNAKAYSSTPYFSEFKNAVNFIGSTLSYTTGFSKYVDTTCPFAGIAATADVTVSRGSNRYNYELVYYVLNNGGWVW